jgi:hypothetical protein
MNLKSRKKQYIGPDIENTGEKEISDSSEGSKFEVDYELGIPTDKNLNEMELAYTSRRQCRRPKWPSDSDYQFDYAV